MLEKLVEMQIGTEVPQKVKNRDMTQKSPLLNIAKYDTFYYDTNPCLIQAQHRWLLLPISHVHNSLTSFPLFPSHFVPATLPSLLLLKFANLTVKFACAFICLWVFLGIFGSLLKCPNIRNISWLFYINNNQSPFPALPMPLALIL